MTKIERLQKEVEVLRAEVERLSAIRSSPLPAIPWAQPPYYFGSPTTGWPYAPAGGTSIFRQADGYAAVGYNEGAR